MIKLSKYNLKFFLFKNKLRAFLFLLFAVLLAVFSGMEIIWNTFLFNALAIKDLENIILYLSLSATSLFLWLIFYLLTEYVKETTVKKIKADMRNLVNKRILEAKISFINNISDGKFINLINNDLTIVEEKYLMPFFDLLNTVLGIFASFVSFFILSPIIGAIIIVLGISNIFIPYFSKQYLNKKTKEFSKKNEEYSSRILRYLSIFNFLKINNKMKLFRKKTQKANLIISDNIKKFEIIQFNIKTIQIFFTVLLSQILLAVTIPLFMNNFVPIGIFASILFQGYQLLNNMSNISTYFISISGSKKLVSKPFNYFEKEKYNFENKEKISTFKKIKFNSYKSLLNFQTDSNPWNITIEKGKKYLITGNNGIGKSILLKSLLNINKKYSGEIKIDNLNVKDIDNESINNLILYNTNNTFLLDNRSLNENIIFSEKANTDKNKLQKAIKEANLNFYNENIIINENSNNLSQGQIQRIGLARAFYFNNEIQIYDESLSNLDADNRSTILKNILNKKEKTIIVIAHHLELKYHGLFDKEINLSNL